MFLVFHHISCSVLANQACPANLLARLAVIRLLAALVHPEQRKMRMKVFSSQTIPPDTDFAAEGARIALHQRRERRQHWRNTLIFWCFVGPLFLGLLVFFFIPIIWGIILSFSQANSTLTPTGFAGFGNYQAMLSDPYFVESLRIFFVFALFIVPTTFFCSLGLALLVSSVKIGQGFFRLIFFLPTA